VQAGASFDPEVARSDADRRGAGRSLTTSRRGAVPASARFKFVVDGVAECW
jgi:hypothetical protein